MIEPMRWVECLAALAALVVACAGVTEELVSTSPGESAALTATSVSVTPTTTSAPRPMSPPMQTAPVTALVPAQPTIPVEEEGDHCLGRVIHTSHWFGESGSLDPGSDIVLIAAGVGIDSDDQPAAALVATGADGIELRLEMTLGNPPAMCEGEVYFDLPPGDPARINTLSPPIAIRFEINGAVSIHTAPVTFPDDFPLAPPFGNVELTISSD